jgi:arginyl-tRNA synthetase
MKAELRELVRGALERARDAGALGIEEIPPVHVEVPRETGHGDLASNVAMSLAKSARSAPRRIAEAILAHLEDPDGLLDASEIAGPGFLNFTFSAAAWRGRLVEIIEAGDAYGTLELGRGQKIQVEFVSANPTGPLHIGHGRGAATGDALARVLEAAGYEVEREYYTNDAGVQMNVLGRSVHARYLQALGVDAPFPEDGYPGDYVGELAEDLVKEEGERWREADADQAVAWMGRWAGERMLERIRSDLAAFGIRFDHFTSERELREAGLVEAALDELREAGQLYDADGAAWFASTRYGDDKDRTVVKSDGQLTYFASDIAYHREKLRGGYDRIIDIWGADHHGYVGRMRAALEALCGDKKRFSVVLVQMVNLTRDGQPVRMGKRSGEFISLADVLEEVGPDLARFFFLMRKSDAQVDFDLELARRQSAENPVFYVQYAYTRIAGIFRQAEEKGIAVPEAPDAAAVAALDHPDELALIKVLDDFPDVVEGAATALEPHRVVFYVQRLAGEFHRFYTRHKCVSDDAERTTARLVLVRAVGQVIGRALSMVGVSAPETM